MPLKILGGKFKGFGLNAPKGSGTRPTSVMLRRKIFDSHQNLAGYVFIDAYAGSGAVGFEALSRGSDEVFFIEKSKTAYHVLTKNIRLLEEKHNFQKEQVKSFPKEFKVWFQRFRKTYEKWSIDKREKTIIFFDPPYEYHDEYMQIALEDILKGQWYGGKLWLESDNQKGIPQEYWESQDVNILNSFKQGTSFILVFETII